MKNPLTSVAIRTRLLSILIVFLIPIAALTYELNSKLEDAIEGSMRESGGAALSAPLAKLMNLVADRQMSEVQKQAGEGDKDKDIAEATGEADKFFDQLAAAYAKHADDADLTPEGLKKHGRPDTLTVDDLKKKWDTIKAAPTYVPDTYKALLAELASMIEHIGNASGLVLDSDLDTFYLIDANFNVFPDLVLKLTDLQQTGFLTLNGDKKTDPKSLDYLDNIAGLVESIYVPHVDASITTALKEDANFNGISESFQTNISKRLADFDTVAKKIEGVVHGVNGGTTMKPNDFVDAIDEMHNATGDFAQSSMVELQKMLDTRMGNLRQQRNMMMGGLAAVIAFAFFLFFVVAKSISKPIISMTDAMKVLAAGDTTTEIPSTENTDEIGGMAKAVLVFKENMIETDRLRKEQELQKAEAERQKSITMNQMADNFESTVKIVVTEVSASADQMRGNAERLSTLAGETKSNSGVVASSATEAAQTASQVAAAAEELTAAIGEISSQVQKSSSVASQASAQAESINQSMHMLVEKSNRVGEVIQFITNIASQINLLALNATIESARAGEAGRGFAVVASEVKNLANQTAKATEEIVQQVQSMQEATQEAVQSVGSIINIIGEISQNTAGVAAAVEEQSAATNEISRNIAHTAAGTNEISRSIGAVEKGADETGTSSRQVLDSAKALSGQASVLSDKVNEFLRTVRAM